MKNYGFRMIKHRMLVVLSSLIKKNQIKSILYQSQSVKEALDKIENVWFEYGYNLPEYRNMYYYYMGLETPTRLQEQKIDTNSFTPRAV